MLRRVTKGALTQARAKLDPQVFLYLIRKSQEYIEKHLPLQRFKGFRLFAIDSSSLYLHQNEKTLQHFEGQTNQSDKTIAMARMSQCFDVLNGFTQDIQVAPYTTGERDFIPYHCMNIPQDSLLLLDRGYPSYPLFYQLVMQNQNFVARASIQFNSAVKRFVESDDVDALVSFEIPQDWKHEEELPEEIELRLVKVDLESGVEVLITSLLDAEKYPRAIFKDLYQKRWPVEEDFKKLKSATEVENFSGKTVHSVYQDIYAKALSKNIAIALQAPLIEDLAEKTKGRKHVYQFNLSNALSNMKNSIIKLLTGQLVEECLNSLTAIWMNTLEPVRKGRRYPRKKKYDAKYNMNYKALC